MRLKNPTDSQNNVNPIFEWYKRDMIAIALHASFQIFSSDFPFGEKPKPSLSKTEVGLKSTIWKYQMQSFIFAVHLNVYIVYPSTRPSTR